MLKRHFALLLAVICLLLTPTPAWPQADPGFDWDPRALATRLTGFDAAYAFPPLSPLYEVGDELEFWVGKADQTTPTRVTATLAALTPGVYLWVEAGIAYDADSMAEFARFTDEIQRLVRQRDTYGQQTIIPGLGPVASSASRIALPNVDSDPHLYILYTRDLGSTQYVINPYDFLAGNYAPGGYSNQHELILLNTSFLPDVALDHSAYISALIRALFDLVNQINTPGQARWLDEALAWDLAFKLQESALPPDVIRAYFRNPLISLLATTQSGGNVGLLGGQKLFLDYAAQRSGMGYVRALYAGHGPGMEPINQALSSDTFIDAISAQPITANDLFADFVIANVINAPLGDGRFVHRLNTLPDDQSPAGQVITDSRFSLTDQAVGQYGTSYFYITPPQAAAFTLTFNGQPTTPRLPFEADRAAEDRFYWSGSAASRDITLTRPVDLSAVDSATLTFDTWYHLSEAWNYAYIMVSTDNGQSWQIIGEAGEAKVNNRYGVAYGPGLTGIGDPHGPRPFPYIGIEFDSDGMTITDITADAPASETELRIGDRIIGYDETLWPNGPNILGLLANYQPGDTLDLYIQRGTQRLSIPLILGEHPERMLPAQPGWLTHTYDLSAFVGQEILLRFEYISLPRHENPGIALDNIRIPEIDYRDDVEAESDWDNQGWQQVDNQLAQNFLVQFIVSGTQAAPPGVRPLITPADPATSGEWSFNLEANQLVVLAISGLNGDTLEPATFDVAFGPSPATSEN